ncbi:MAG: hypothetical protein HYS53_02405 [Candidatus Aenigmarchaeota archaeon]|nr:hypothetical protein [Candidatus Aenigmarchaeota archaeon]
MKTINKNGLGLNLEDLHNSLVYGSSLIKTDYKTFNSIRIQLWSSMSDKERREFHDKRILNFCGVPVVPDQDMPTNDGKRELIVCDRVNIPCLKLVNLS